LSNQESSFSPKNDIKSRKLLWLDAAALVEASGVGDAVQPLYLADAVGKPGVLSVRSLSHSFINKITMLAPPFYLFQNLLKEEQIKSFNLLLTYRTLLHGTYLPAISLCVLFTFLYFRFSLSAIGVYMTFLRFRKGRGASPTTGIKP
jgi:cytochrome oxidase assembly protein ShyY1